MGKIIDSDMLIAVAENIARMSDANNEKEIGRFTEAFRLVTQLVPEAIMEKPQNEECGEWGEIVKIGVSMAYGCKKCGEYVVQPLEKTTYRFCPHCGAENGEREVK